MPHLRSATRIAVGAVGPLGSVSSSLDETRTDRSRSAPLTLALVFLGPKWLITLVVAGVAVLAGWEFLGLARHSAAKPPRVAVAVALLLFAGNFEWPDQTLLILGVLSLGLLVYCTFGSPVERVLADASSSVFCLMYVGLTLIAIPTLREQSNGATLVVFLLCVVWRRHRGAVRGAHLGQAQAGSEDQPEQDLGGRSGFRGGQPAGDRCPVLAGHLFGPVEFCEALFW